MIKVTFKEPLRIEQHGLIQICLFVICHNFVNLGEKWIAIIFEEKSDSPFVAKDLIKSIEHVKPTEL